MKTLKTILIFVFLLACSLMVSAAIPAAEREALIAFYNATNGDAWTDNSGWKTPPLDVDGFAMPGTEGTWHGVATDASNTTVTSISLDINNLVGTIPTQLGSLGNLSELGLDNNQLTGTIPVELGSLSGLNNLDLSYNQLTGNIPVELGSLSNLTNLILFHNQLTGSIPIELGSLSNLTNLSLGDNQLSGAIPTELGSLSNLEVLQLGSNQLTGSIPAWLGNLSLLSGIDLCCNQFSGVIPTELGNLSSLTNLKLSDNQLSGGIPTELGSLGNLTNLELYNNQLTGGIPTQLGSLSNLTNLDLCYNQLSGSIPAVLGNLTNLHRLCLANNQLTGTIPTELGSLTQLQNLSLNDNQLTGSIPAEIGNLINVGKLDLATNQLTGSIPAALGSMINLQNLGLHSNQLTGTIPPELGNLSSIELLQISSNQVTGSIPSELGNLINLKYLYLNSNSLTGAIPASLTNLVHLNEEGGYTDIGYNALYTFDPGLIAFLNDKDPGWADTQTIAPGNIAATPASSTTINLTWDAISYNGDTGGYRISVGTASGGTYSFFQQAADKSITSLPVSGLNPGTPYYFVISTRTDAHGDQQNTVDSENSAEVSAATYLVDPIVITSPNGGEIWGAGSVHAVTWTSEGALGNVKIEYSSDNGSSWSTIDDSSENDGAYDWTVPDLTSATCLVRVSEAGGAPYDVSNAMFTIMAAGLGAISGRVTDGIGNPIQGINVWFQDHNWGWVSAVDTDVNGNYSMTGLASGSYYVYFWNQYQNFASQYYNNTLWSWLAAPVTVAAGQTVSDIDAVLAAGGSVSGRVTDPGGNPIQGIYVQALFSNGEWGNDASTDADGNYTIPGLPTASYRISFSGNSTYATEHYNNKTIAASADLVAVTASQTVSGINAQMELGGNISGQVTDTSGNPIQGIRVRALSPANQVLRAGNTDASGNYNLRGLPAGQYAIQFMNQGKPYISEYYNNKADFQSADWLTLAAGQTITGINAQLAAGATVSGRVTDAQTGQSLEGIIVYVGTNNSTVTDINGDYSVGVKPGKYRVMFYTTDYNALHNTNYVNTYYGGAYFYPDATVLTVNAGDLLADIDGALAQNGGIITGRVTDAGGQGISSVLVYIITDWSKFDGYTVYTDTNGNYRMAGLAPYDYLVVFFGNFNGSPYLSKYYNNVPIETQATRVAVQWDQTASGIDAVLEEGGSISGRVTDSGGNGIAGVKIRTYNAALSNYNIRTNGTTDAQGYYRILTVPGGDQHVFFMTNDVVSGNYLSQYFNSKGSLDVADIVTVQPGATQAGIDAVLTTGGGSISGYVRDSNGQPMAGVMLELYPTDNLSGAMQFENTDSSSHFEFKGLLPGEYKLYAAAYEFPIEWYSEKTSHAAADTITISVEETHDIVIVLGDAPSISVTAPNGGEAWAAGSVQTVAWTSVGALDNVKIEFSSDNGGSWITIVDSTENDGAFGWTVPDLTSTACLVRVGEADGAPFDVSDAVFTILGSGMGGITGRVTNGAGSGIVNVRVQIRTMSNTNLKTVGTDAEGNFYSGGIAAGDYKIYFKTSFVTNGSYASEWYSHQSAFATADTISVANGLLTTGVDTVLPAGGSISGRVVDEQGIGIPDIGIAVRNMANSTISNSYSDADGNFTIIGLPTGPYKVLFDSSETQGSYVGEWYNNKNSFAEADIVAVIAGQTTENINAVLATGGSISGRVTDAGGTGIPDIEIYPYDGNLNQFGYGFTDADGYYVARGMPSGTYKVNFYSVYYNNTSGHGYKDEWYNNKNSILAADGVAVTAGQTIENIDAVLTEDGGIINGRVTNEGGEGISGVTVYVFRGSESFDNGFQVATNSNGDYQVKGIPAGTYYVWFLNFGDYVSQYYDNTIITGAPGMGNATPLEVFSNSVFNNINAIMKIGGKVSGRVTDGSGNGIANVRVRFHDAATGTYRSRNGGTTDANGYYISAPLTSGQYKAYFQEYEAGNGTYTAEYYNDKITMASADVIAVTAGTTTENIDVVLGTTGAIISGYVRDTSGLPISQVALQLYDPDSPASSLGTVYSKNNGYFAFSKVPAGQYKIYCYDYGRHPSEWYSDQGTHAAATIVTVVNDQTAQLLIIMGDSGTITVTAPNGGETWLFGSSQNITWSHSGNLADVKIEYSTDNGAAWTTIVDATANNGSFTWTVPDTVSSAQCQVRVSEIDGSPVDASDAVFSIYANPAGWTPVQGMQYNMISYGTAYNGNDAAASGDWIGAFGPGGAGDCRAAAQIGANGYYYLTVRGNETSAESITFKLWPQPAGPASDSLETIEFIADNVYSNLPLHFGPRTQTLSFVNGWNWVSWNILPADTSLNGMFAPILGAVLQIKSQTQAAVYTGGSWIGDLVSMSGIGSGIMYKIKTNQVCSLSLSAPGIAFNLPITTVTGWNWVAYLPSQPQPVASAVESIFAAVSQVKSQTQSAIKIGGVLTGDLTEMQPNLGFTIKVTEPGVLVYEHGSQAGASLAGGASALRAGVRGAPNWAAVTGNQYNMVACGKIYFDGTPITKEGYYVGTFGPRGSLDCRSVSPVDLNGSYFATIRGDSIGEAVHFVLYDSNSGKSYEATESVLFQIDDLHANFDLHVSAVTTCTISGIITCNGVPLAGVTLSGLEGDPQTDTAGFYSAAVNTGWSGIVTPVKAGYAFIPASTTYANITASRSTDYTANALSPLTVTSPNGNESWAPGTIHAITWTQDGLSGTVTLELYKNGILQSTLGTSTASAGTFSWAIPAGQALGNDYKIRVFLEALEDFSDGTFAIALAPADFNIDGLSDILWRYYGPGGKNQVWLIGKTAAASQTEPEKIAADVELEPEPESGEPEEVEAVSDWEMMGEKLIVAVDPRQALESPSGDLNAAFAADALPALNVPTQPTATLSVIQTVYLTNRADKAWKIVGTGDFNNDGKADILWRNNRLGKNQIWLMNGTVRKAIVNLPSQANSKWKIVGTGDFNNDGHVDILWRYYGAGGYNSAWLMNGIEKIATVSLPAMADTLWEVVGCGDFNNDCKVDIVWRYQGAGGANVIWLLDGTTLNEQQALAAEPDLKWKIGGVGDCDGDGKPDLIWRYYGPGGADIVWLMNGLNLLVKETLSAKSDLNWKIENH